MSSEAQNRFDRIVAILVQLQSKRLIRAQELADKFNVSLRTIYRDIRSLEAAGVPILGEAGMGYSIMEGYRLPPVMFTREEAASFVAGEKLMQRFTDKTIRDSYESGMSKIRSVLRGSVKDHISALEANIWIEDGRPIFNDQAPDALEILFESIAMRKQVSMLYQGFEKQEAGERVVEPVGVYHEESSWYLFAYCHLRRDYRQFRTDRIRKIFRTDLSFSRNHITLAEFRERTAPPEPTRVVIRIKADILKYIRTGRTYYGFVSEEIHGDMIDMTFLTGDHLEGMARWFMMFGDHAEILEPLSLKEKVKAIAESISRHQ